MDPRALWFECSRNGYGICGDGSLVPLPTTIPVPRLRTKNDLVGWSKDLSDFLQDAVRDVLFQQKTISLATGTHNNVNVGGASLVRILAPTGPFTMTGIAAGSNGKMIILYNTSAFNMTVSNNNAGSAIGNRIITMSGVDIVSA